MNGSIADSTALRLRTGLQRMHHATPSEGSDGFLEELLKLPAVQENQADEVAPTDEPIHSLPTTAAAKPSEETEGSGDEPRDQDETTFEEPLPCVPVCYAPAPIAQPQITEPVGQPQAQEDGAAVPTPVLATTVATEQVRPVVPDSTIEPVVRVDDQAIDTQPANLELVQPVQAKVETVTKENIAKTVRDLRRPKDAREKIDTRVAPTVDDSKNPTTPVHQPAPTHAVETDQTDKHPSSQAQPVDQGVQPMVEQPAEPTGHRNEDRPQRDKWYEAPRGGNDDGQASVVQRMQDTLREQGNVEEDSAPQATNEAISELTDKVVEAGALMADASMPPVIEPSLMASDIAAAAGANLSQSIKSQTVTEATRTAGGDVMGRGHQQPVTGALGTATGLRHGTVASSATAATQSDSADQPREITQQERVRLVQRVARSFSRLGPDGGQVTLKLHPPQLGVLNVSIKIDGQTLTARMQTETSAARDAIIESLPLLRERLNEQGIEIEKFQVEVGQQEDLSSGSGQTNSFTGNGSGSQNESTATEYDYRRVARAHALRQSVAAPVLSEPRGQGWPTNDRSLDVKA